MTASSWIKTFKQVKHKKADKQRQLKHNKPNHPKFGRGSKRCKICLRYGAHIRKYGLNVCRQCFREIASDLGFKKFG